LNVRLAFGKEIHYLLQRFYQVNFKSGESFSKFFKWRWFSTVSGDLLRGKQKRELEVREVKVNDGFTLRIGSHMDLFHYDDPRGVFFGYMKLGERILKQFYSRHIPEKDPENKDRKPPVEVEFGFGNRKDDGIEIGGFPLLGFIDRIDEIRGKWYITDYKTDKNSPRENSFLIDRHPQFTIYSYAFRKIFGVKEQNIIYYYLRGNDPLKTHRDEKDYDYVKRLISKVVEGICRDEFVPFYGFHCNFCDLQSACEKYSIPFHGGPRIDLEGRIRGANRFKEWDVEVPDWVEYRE